jgi:hypothetical protein
MRASRWIVAAVLLTTLAAAPPMATARTPKPKQSISAVVNGHRVKFKRNAISSSGSADTGFATGGAQQPHRLGQTLRGLVVGCAIGLASSVFPVDGQYCTMGYSETKFSRNPTFKQWAAVEGVRVTITSFDGSRVNGTFDGMLLPATPGADYGPATVQGGKFSIVLE